MTKKRITVSLLLASGPILWALLFRSGGTASAQRPPPQVIEPRDAWELVPAIEDGITTDTVRSYRFLAGEERTTYTLQVVTRSFRRVKLDDDGTTVFVRQLKASLEMNPETGEITRR